MSKTKSAIGGCLQQPCCAAGNESETCPKCWGDGYVWKSDYIVGMFHAADYSPYEQCATCGGTGRVKKAKPQHNEKADLRRPGVTLANTENFMSRKITTKPKGQSALASAQCSTTTTKCQVTIVPSYRYTLQWNFGKSQCSFNTIDDVKEFIRDNLKLAESHVA